MEIGLTTSPKSRLLISIKCLSSLIAIAGIFFIIQQVFQYSEELKAYSLPDNIVSITILVSVVYGVSNLLLATGWHRILVLLGTELTLKKAIRIYSFSQLGKYVPGNIFQFVGRHALAFSAGMANGKLAKSTLYEFGALIFSGLICIPLATNYLSLEISPNIIMVSFSALILITLIMCRALLGNNSWKIFLYYLVFLVCSGLCFTAVFSVISQQALTFSIGIYLVGSYIFAWLAGLVAPGAPAGLGIREAVLTLMLTSIAPTSIILFAILISRLSTVIGDVIFFTIGQTSIFKTADTAYLD